MWGIHPFLVSSYYSIINFYFGPIGNCNLLVVGRFLQLGPRIKAVWLNTSCIYKLVNLSTFKTLVTARV